METLMNPLPFIQRILIDYFLWRHTFWIPDRVGNDKYTLSVMHPSLYVIHADRLPDALEAVLAKANGQAAHEA
jgi:hypothetical protein